MNLHQLSVTYVDEQDRLLVRFNTTEGDELRLWLTRRMVSRVLEPLQDAAGQLEARKIALPQDSPQARRVLAELKRAEVVQGSDFSTPYRSTPDDKLPLGSLPLLVTQLRMTVTKAAQLHVGFEEKLADPSQPRGFQVAMEAPMVHGLIHLLEQAVAKSQWDIGGATTFAVSSADDTGEGVRPKYLQ